MQVLPALNGLEARANIGPSEGVRPGPLDVVAIKMACCHTYYACIDCHRELADHPSVPWPEDALDTPAVLCGVCRHEMTIRTYLERNDCPDCRASFNPRCSLHYPLYFTLPDSMDQP